MPNNNNYHDLRIAPSSPSKSTGRASPASISSMGYQQANGMNGRSPTTPNSAVPAWMNIPLPSSDTSHSQHSHSYFNGDETRQQHSGGGGMHGSRDNSPTSRVRTPQPGRSFERNEHSATIPLANASGVSMPPNITKTAPGPPIPSRQMSMQATGPGVNEGASRKGSTASEMRAHGFNHNNIEHGLSAENAEMSAMVPSASEQGKSASAAMTLPPGAICGNCEKPVKRQFVRAMNKVYHLDCFRCKVSIQTYLP